MKDKRGYMNKSQTEEWETDDILFNKLNMVFDFKVDLACSEQNKKCKIGITKEQNSLTVDWNKFKYKNLWLNPPYGKQLKLFVEKVDRTSYNNNCLCMLIPASTETKSFQDVIFENAKLIIFIKGRLQFLLNGKKSGSSTKGSALVFFGELNCEQIYSLKKLKLGKMFIIDSLLEEVMKPIE